MAPLIAFDLCLPATCPQRSRLRGGRVALALAASLCLAGGLAQARRAGNALALLVISYSNNK